MAFAAITWKDFVNTAYFPATDCLQKISGVNNVYDADAISEEQIEAANPGAGMKWNVPWFPDGWGVPCGLTADNPGPDPNDIDFCIFARYALAGAVYIYENGVWKYTSLGYTAGDEVKILINNSGQIEYYHLDVLLYTSLTAPTFPLFADCGFLLIGDRICQATIEVGALKVDHLPLCGVH